MKSRLLVLLLAVASLPAFASVMPIVAGVIPQDGDFWSGIMHPLNGIDHLLVALSVGMLCAMPSERFRCLIPIGFLFFMLLGAAAGMLHIAFPLVNYVVALSVIAVGVLIAVNRDLPVSFIMAFVGVLALFHGHLHGEQMVGMNNVGSYGIGFLLGTFFILFVGRLVGAGLMAIDKQSRWLRYAGSAIAAFGSYLVAGVLWQAA